MKFSCLTPTISLLSPAKLLRLIKEIALTSIVIPGLLISRASYTESLLFS